MVFCHGISSKLVHKYLITTTTININSTHLHNLIQKNLKSKTSSKKKEQNSFCEVNITLIPFFEYKKTTNISHEQRCKKNPQQSISLLIKENYIDIQVQKHIYILRISPAIHMLMDLLSTSTHG